MSLRRIAASAGAVALGLVPVVGLAPPASALVGIPIVPVTLPASVAASTVSLAQGASVVAEATSYTAAAAAVGDTAAAVVAGAGATTIAAAAGAGLAVGSALYLGWQLGNGPLSTLLLGNTDVAASQPTGFTFSSGWSITNQSLNSTGGYTATVHVPYAVGPVQAISSPHGSGWVSFGSGYAAGADVTVSPSSSYASTGDYGCVRVWNAAGTQLAFMWGFPGPSACGAPIVSPSGSGTDSTTTTTTPATSTGGSPGGTDIQRDVLTTRQCVDASGGNLVTVTAKSAAFTGSTIATKGVPVAPVPACPSGSPYPLSSTTVVEPTTPGQVPNQTVATWTAPGGTPVLTTTPITLEQLQPDGSKVTCEQSPSPCAGWWSDPNKTTDYVCMQGTTVLQLSECDVLITRYDVPTPTTPTGNVADSSCLGGWTWNPVDWVLRPVECALKWAFVPDPAVLQTDVQTLQTSWATSPVGTFTTGVVAIPAAVGSGLTDTSTCAGPSLQFPMPGGAQPITVHPFDTCQPPMSTVAAFVKTGTGVLLIVGLALVAQRLILSAFGMPYLTLHRGGGEST